jgi:hypothetical protein
MVHELPKNGISPVNLLVLTPLAAGSTEKCDFSGTVPFPFRNFGVFHQGESVPRRRTAEGRDHGQRMFRA